MNRYVLTTMVGSAFLGTAMVGCSGDTEEVKQEPAPVVAEEKNSNLTSGLYLDYMDKSVKPGDDFNKYVNGGWMKTAVIPADRASATVGLEVHEAATENVRKIIEESASGDFAKGSDEQKVGDLYASYMDMETRNALGIKPIEAELDKIAAISNKEHLAIYFAESNKYGISQPFVLGQYVDFKDPNTYMMYTWQSGLGLPASLLLRNNIHGQVNPDQIARCTSCMCWDL